MSDYLPFACCPHCECPASEAVGHDDTCRLCQHPDGTPMTVQPEPLVRPEDRRRPLCDDHVELDLSEESA